MKDPDVAFGIDIGPDEFPPLAAIHVLGNRRPILDESIRIRKLQLLAVCDRRKHREKCESSSHHPKPPVGQALSLLPPLRRRFVGS
jgi:hypothetical protein